MFDEVQPLMPAKRAAGLVGRLDTMNPANSSPKWMDHVQLHNSRTCTHRTSIYRPRLQEIAPLHWQMDLIWYISVIMHLFRAKSSNIPGNIILRRFSCAPLKERFLLLSQGMQADRRYFANLWRKADGSGYNAPGMTNNERADHADAGYRMQPLGINT